MTRRDIRALPLTITVLLLIGSIASVAVNSIQSIEAASKGRVSNDCIPLSASGNNVYVASWDKKTGNWEVFVARSTDNGTTFEDSVNLSNSPKSRSDDAHIFALNDNVYTTWWETSKNGTTVPVFRASNDNGATFGPILKLPANGTIGEGQAK